MAKTKLVRSDLARQEPDGRLRRGIKARANVLDRAVNVASTNGLEGLTIGGLASDLGISKGNITVLFGDKEGLQLKTLDAAVDVFFSHVVRPALGEPSPIRRLQKLCNFWFDYVEERILPGGCILSATGTEYRARPGSIQNRVNFHRTAWHSLLAKTIHAAKDAEELNPELDVQQLVFELVAFQLAANTAALLGDQKFFLRARRITQAQISKARMDDESSARVQPRKVKPRKRL
ncbi:TetR/AcrR family transcriptional regulator [Bradyrhizobium sp.]|jgi:AcrR family transcriptional regulator|uniref:TetR/AcrR family transcriptional regulator n=1 Tax=Bradyrhizobium sp. TaxID=376 RepID=UPI003C5C0928